MCVAPLGRRDRLTHARDLGLVLHAARMREALPKLRRAPGVLAHAGNVGAQVDDGAAASRGQPRGEVARGYRAGLVVAAALPDAFLLGDLGNEVGPPLVGIEREDGAGLLAIREPEILGVR